MRIKFISKQAMLKMYPKRKKCLIRDHINEWIYEQVERERLMQLIAKEADKVKPVKYKNKKYYVGAVPK